MYALYRYKLKEISQSDSILNHFYKLAVKLSIDFIQLLIILMMHTQSGKINVQMMLVEKTDVRIRKLPLRNIFQCTANLLIPTLLTFQVSGNFFLTRLRVVVSSSLHRLLTSSSYAEENSNAHLHVKRGRTTALKVTRRGWE